MSTYEELKNRADALKAKRDKAMGAAEQIEESWMRTYGTKDPEVLKEKLKTLQTELGEVQNEYLTKMETVERLLDGAGA